MEICILGDFCPRHQSKLILDAGYADVIDEKLVSHIRKADLSIVNIECPLTLSNRRFVKSGPNLKIAPEFAHFLVDCGFHLATLANNHIYDYGQDGLDDTLKICAQNGMATVGAGKTIKEARQTCFRSVGGARLAIVNVAENESCAATKYHGGAHPLDVIENVRRIKSATIEADIVLVIVHGGNELCPYPSPQVVQRYRFFIENGAHAVVAHHPHVIQGYEIYNGAPIIYSLGNFLFPLLKNRMLSSFADSWSKGMGVSLMFPFAGEKSLKIFAFHQCADEPKVVSFSAAEEGNFKKHLSDLSKPIGEADTLERLWKENLYEQADTLLWYLSFGSLPMQAVRKALSGMGLLRPLIRNKRRTNFLRLAAIRTEAHRELLIGTLDDIFK